MTVLLLVVMLSVAHTLQIQAQDQPNREERFFDWARMTFPAVEPWYYNHDTELAVFVEAEVLVTADGAEVLTTLLPRTPRRSWSGWWLQDGGRAMPTISRLLA